jgi:hypothetical protein
MAISHRETEELIRRAWFEWYSAENRLSWDLGQTPYSRRETEELIRKARFEWY